MKMLLLLPGIIMQGLLHLQGNKAMPGPVPVAPVADYADSLDIKIGQMIIFGFYGTRPDKNEPVYKAVKEGKVGSILIYGRNIPVHNTAAGLKALIRYYQQAAPLPLFVSIDQEGGLVNRLPDSLGFPSMPSALSIGRMNDPERSKYYSDNIAYTLSRLGINLNYAPVLDLHNPGCPVMGARQRCFSGSPKEVAGQASSVVNSHNYFRVHTVLKHFPGHGNSTTDSHFGVTDVTKTWTADELLPYKILIDSGLADAVMTAHIVNGKLDPSRMPATLSYPIITGLLRDSLGFQGVIFSDDMLMQAISSQFGLKESILKAITAGVDVLMFSNNIKGVRDYSPDNIHKIIKELVISGKISPERVDASYRRVMAMKGRWKG